MYEASANPTIKQAIEEGRRQRAAAFGKLFRRTRPNPTHQQRGSDLATM